MLRADDNIHEWQPWQADDALKLYYLHYLGQGALKHVGVLKSDDPLAALQEVKRLIRLRHYSYSTERTYLQWIERFFAYALVKEKKPSDLASDDFKNFLSHLAMKQRVSPRRKIRHSMRLFLYRHVLGKETGDLGNTVRAKRGQKLPAYLPLMSETAFSHMNGMYLLMAEMLYGSGMRLMELARLRVKDIDFGADTIFVRSGKGDKDRSTVCVSGQRAASETSQRCKSDA